MAFSKIVLCALLVVACTMASPIRPEISALETPILIQEPVALENEPIDQQSPEAYAILVAPFYPRETLRLKKRSAEASELEDLETAAGTNALRPLFVYRQQVAYRQRVREAIRRRYRF